MIIDTSVTVKWFYEEAETAKALRLFEGIMGHTIRAVVPDLLFYEFANVLKTKGRADRTKTESALATLHELPWTVIAPDQHFISHALQVAEQYGISVYDASYVALAFEWDVPLITADERLVRLVGGPTVQLLKEYEK